MEQTYEEGRGKLLSSLSFSHSSLPTSSSVSSVAKIGEAGYSEGADMAHTSPNEKTLPHNTMALKALSVQAVRAASAHATSFVSALFEIQNPQTLKGALMTFIHCSLCSLFLFTTLHLF